MVWVEDQMKQLVVEAKVLLRQQIREVQDLSVSDQLVQLVAVDLLTEAVSHLLKHLVVGEGHLLLQLLVGEGQLLLQLVVGQGHLLLQLVEEEGHLLVVVGEGDTHL